LAECGLRFEILAVLTGDTELTGLDQVAVFQCQQRVQLDQPGDH